VSFIALFEIKQLISTMIFATLSNSYPKALDYDLRGLIQSIDFSLLVSCNRILGPLTDTNNQRNRSSIGKLSK
jgi:hypothetical protein